MKVYLVVIDTTGKQVKHFTKGIQNFYFVRAPDGQTAKQMVIASFGRRPPQLLNELHFCTHASPVEEILRLLNDKANSWSYIPIGGVRAPGQQAALSNEVQKVISNPNVTHAEWTPPKPKTYESQNNTQDDPGKISGRDAQIARPSPAPAPVAGNMDPNDPNMQQAFAAFMQFYNQQQGTPNPAPVNPNEIEVPVVDPASDPELQARIKANMRGGHSSDATVNDDDIPPEYRDTDPTVNPWGDDLDQVDE